MSITTGRSSTAFSPDDTVTRGELATFLYRYKGSPAVDIDDESPGCVTFESLDGINTIGDRGAL